MCYYYCCMLMMYAILPLLAIVFNSAQSSGESVCNTTVEFQCPDSKCLQLSEVCDYYDDCGNYTDEINCVNRSPVDMSMALFYCVVDRDTATSTLVKLFGNPDNYTTSSSSILDLGNGTSQLPVVVRYRSPPYVGQVRAVALDYWSRLAYFDNALQGRIEYGSYVYDDDDMQGDRYFNAPPKTRQINGIAVDWLSKVIYWTDEDYKLIAALPSAVPTLSWKPIISDDLNSPIDIAVNPLATYLFWSDVGNGTSDAKIERSDLAGINRTLLVTSSNLVYPTGLVVDFASQRLFWLDAVGGHVGSCGFDGSQLAEWPNDAFRHMSSMTVFKSYIFFGDKRQPTVYIYDKFNGSMISNFTASKKKKVPTATLR